MTDVAAGPLRPLERPTPLSESVIWRLQRAWFEQEGARAWSTGTVPHMITSNAVVGASYARLIAAFLREWRDRAAAPPRTRAYVVELGSGSGRLGYHLVTRLAERLDAMPALADVPVTYVMTDLARSTIGTLRRNDRLRGHIDAGRLDFAVLDAGDPGEVELLESGVVLRPGSLDAPIVVVANYVLDSLPQDAYSIVGSDVVEHRATACALPGASAMEMPSLDLFELTWTRTPVGSGPRYGDTEIDGLFWELSRPGADRDLLFPIVALRCLRRLRSFTREPMLVLSADKGYGDAPAALSFDGPHLARHGCVSFMVDYAVLAADVRRQGGVALLPRQPDHLTVGCFLYDRAQHRWPDLQLAYADFVAQLGPDGFFTVNSMVETAVESATMGQLLAWLRVSEWDGAVFRMLYSRLLHLVIHSAGPDPVLASALARVEATYFPIGDDHDVPRQLAILHWHMGNHAETLRLLRWSEAVHGPDPTRWVGQALALMALGEVELAFAVIRPAASVERPPPLAVELYRFLWDRQEQVPAATARQWSQVMANRGR